RMMAAFRLRRALYDETWTMGSYLAWSIRLLTAIAGFRILLIAAPAIAAAAGRFDWLAALRLGCVLLLWQTRSAGVFRALTRARPIKDGELLTRFQGVAAASTAPQPRFELVELGGGAIANALALPSQRGSSVIYTDTLLRLLDADETVAITG